MADNHTIDYAAPAPKSVNWVRVTLPLVMGAGPVALAFFCFSFGYGGMIPAAFALMFGYILSPAAALLAISHSIIYRRTPPALALSLLAVVVSAAALYYEIWRMQGQWD